MEDQLMMDRPCICDAEIFSLFEMEKRGRSGRFEREREREKGS